MKNENYCVGWELEKKERNTVLGCVKKLIFML